MSRNLSKTQFLNWLQCKKKQWTHCNRPEDLPEISLSQEYLFDQGELIGAYAKMRYPQGIEIRWGGPGNSKSRGLKKTRDLLEKRVPLFEAGFAADGRFSAADVLYPVGDDEWDIIEVKSSTKVKEVNIYDVAFQMNCYKRAGLKIRRCFLMHVDNDYVREGDIDPKKLLKKEDITEQVEELGNIDALIEEAIATMSQKTMPEVDIGTHCNDPYNCSLVEKCWSILPENNVFDLYYGGKKAAGLYESGIHAIKDIPDDVKLSPKQRIQKRCTISGRAHVDKEALSDFLDSLEFPLHYLDFETFGTAAPLYDCTLPYQQIPFQFSLHIQGKKHARLVHHAFLADGKSDPRKGFLEELVKHIRPTGSIIVYNQSFEKARLNELAMAFPERHKWVEQVNDRMRDLLVPFRSFHYYHPSQHGSASIKNVLPALTGRSYDGMAISNGGDAGKRFLEIATGKADEQETAQIRKDLLEYCDLDTWGLVLILRKLRKKR